MAKNSTRFLKKAGQKLYIMRSEFHRNFYNCERNFIISLKQKAICNNISPLLILQHI